MSIASQSGVLDRADNRLDVDGLSGTISTSRTWVVLDEGGIATLTYDPRTYFAARFVTEPSAGSRTVGVVGVATSANTLPSGTANYAGSTTMTVQSGSNLYELEGDATITAQFGGSGSVQTKLNSLDGTVSTGNNAPTSIANFGDITVSGSVIEGSSFSGGTVDVRSNFITVAADGDVVLEGQFFGFRASEVGGVLVVDDSLTGNTRIFADFLAQ